jgi:hypothetical protein
MPRKKAPKDSGENKDIIKCEEVKKKLQLGTESNYRRVLELWQ